MKIIVVLILLLFHGFNSLFGQTILGSIHDSLSNEVISSANIIITETSIPEKTIGFQVVRDGYFRIKLSEVPTNTILIKINSTGYKYYEHKLEQLPFKHDFKLEVKLIRDTIIQLDEVLLNANRKFSVKKDTITYNVEAYRDGTEQKIIDLIKKLPGIQLLKNGVIKYHGKSIETVLLDGDNLFGSNYPLGTNNLNVDMVEQVQAIEKFSENPLLKNIENDEKVALNLTLKKNEIDFSGNIDLGIGVFDSYKSAWDLNSNFLAITKKHKSFNTLAYNNIGVNHSPNGSFEFRIDLDAIEEKRISTQKIIPELSSKNVLSVEKTNINNQQFYNYNSVFDLGKHLKVRANIYYLKDRITSNQYFENQYMIDEVIFETSDNSLFVKEPEQFRGEIDLKYAVSDKSLLEYNLRTDIESRDNKAIVNSNNNNLYQSLWDSDNIYYRQRLIFTNKISAEKAFQINLFQSTNEMKQNYLLSPSALEPNYFESDSQKSQLTKNFIEVQSRLLGVSSRKDRFNFSFGGAVDYNKLETELLGDGKELISKNDIKYSAKSLYHSGLYGFKFKQWTFTPSYTFRYLNQEIVDQLSTKFDTNNHWNIKSSFLINYRINTTSYLSAIISADQISNTEEYLFLNKILINNRLTISSEPSLELQRRLNYGLNYFNNDLYNQLQISCGINFQEARGGFFSNSLITENTTQINYFYLPQNNDNLIFNLLIAKYIPILVSTIRYNSTYSISNYKNFVNNSDLRNNQGKVLNMEVSFKTAFNGFIDFENKTSFVQSTSASEDSNTFSNRFMNNNLKVMMTPTKKWFLLLSLDSFLPDLENRKEYYNFFDTTLQYQPKNSNYRFNLGLRNLLNEKNFEEVQTTDISTNIFRTNILPRLFMINMTYNF